MGIVTPSSGVLSLETPTTVEEKGRAVRLSTDIQALRALAILLVLIYHAGFTLLSGGFIGVDVFFVISGFLITTHLVQGITAGRLKLSEFYARRIRRILPVSVFVMLATAAAAAVLIPPVLFPRVLRELAWTAIYAPNIHFAMQNVDYLSDKSPSVFQQYWSLGVEEQFYLVWPLLLLAIFALSRRRLRYAAVLVLSLVVLSFGAGVVITSISQPVAFFLLPTRAWELGVGALLAIIVLQWGRCKSRHLAMLLGILGLTLILSTAFLYTSETPFPSFFALVPVLGTALIIYAGNDAHGTLLSRMLSARPIQWVGLVSYSLYLIHWPVLMLAPYVTETADNGWSGIPLIMLCLVLAGGLHRWVEAPFRYRRGRSTSRGPISFALFAGAGIAVASFAFVPLVVSLPLYGGPPVEADGTPTREPTFGDLVPANLTPGLRVAEGDAPAIHDSGCHAGHFSVDPTPCEFGESDERTVRLFGDSHAASWSPALELLASEGKIALSVNTKGGCPSVDIPVEDYPECGQWRENVIEEAISAPTDFLVIANSDSYPSLGSESKTVWADGIHSLRERLPSSTTLIVFQDVPVFSERPDVCLSLNLRSAQNCRQSMDEIVDEGVRLAINQSGAVVFDPTRYLCAAGECSPMVGNYLAYMDTGHLSATFSRAMAPNIWEEWQDLFAVDAKLGVS